jgi:hypothetical protein
MLSNAEIGRRPAEQALMTDVTGDIACGVINRVGSNRGIVVDRVFPLYKVSYHHSGSLDISSPNVNVFFYPRDVVGQINQQEMVREIRTADGRNVLSKRTLTVAEAQGLSRIVVFPSQREQLEDATEETLIIDRLVSISEEEQGGIVIIQSLLISEEAELAAEAQAATNLHNTGNRLHTVFVARPARQE